MDELFEGFAVGGPLDGQEIISRYAKGILYADVVGNRCWVYKLVGCTFFLERDEADNEERELDAFKLEKTGVDEFDYDVIAYTDPVEEVENVY